MTIARLITSSHHRTIAIDFFVYSLFARNWPQIKMLTNVNKGIFDRLFPKSLFSLFIVVKFSSSSCYCAIVIASLYHRHGTVTPLCHHHRIMSSSLHRPRPRLCDGSIVNYIALSRFHILALFLN